MLYEPGDSGFIAFAQSRGDEARRLVERFQTMIRKNANDDLDPWISDAYPSLIASFAHGVVKDKAAVLAAITEPWSNGQTEGQIARLKLVKRQMFGRAKLDLLQARLLGAALQSTDCTKIASEPKLHAETQS